VNLEQPGSIGGGLVAPGDHLADLGLLLSGELGAASTDATFLAAGIQTGFSPLSEHGSLKLSKGPDHLHHHAAGGGGGVDGFGQAAEPCLGFGQALHNYQHIPQRAGEPVELLHQQHVALAKLIQEPLQFGPVPAPARRFLAIGGLPILGVVDRSQERGGCGCGSKPFAGLRIAPTGLP
jgi:hypothetical protein